MRALWTLLADLPPLARWSILGVGGGLLVLGVGVGVAAVIQQREAAAARAFAVATRPYGDAMAPNRTAEQLEVAANALQQFLRDRPRSSLAARAWYDLGNVEYQRGAYDAALKAFGEAMSRDAGTVRDLSQLAIGYVREAQEDVSGALGAYREALAGRDPGHFLYGELLLGMGRAHEQLDQPDQAREAYERFLRDVPDSPRAGDVRSRLALLGGRSQGSAPQ